MDYAEVTAAFFRPRDGVSGSGLDDTPGRRLRNAIEPIAAVTFWSEPAFAAYAGLGLEFLSGYVLSRSYPMGNAAPSVVGAAFGVFAPGLVEGLCEQGREITTLEAMDGARRHAARESLGECLESTADIAACVSILRRACEMAGTRIGRPLYAGLTGLDWPDDPYVSLWHVCTMLREYRGDSHLAACAVHGLGGLEANILTELRVGWAPLEYTATRGWPADTMEAGLHRLESAGLVADGSLTADGQRLRTSVEDFTERAVEPVIAAIGADLDAVVTTAKGWSQAIIDRGWFPPDPYKRAAG